MTTQVDPHRQRVNSHLRSPGRQPSGQGLLVAFVIGILAMTVAVVVTNSVGDPWILIPVMAVDVAVTFGIITSVVRLLSDGGDDDDDAPARRGA